MRVGVDTSVAGARAGTVTLAYQTDGTGSSGLGTLEAGSQTIEVSGNVYQLAAGQLNSAPLNFGTVQVGQTVSQNLSISNIATGPSGFVEDLNAEFGATTGIGSNLISGNGSISGLLAGATDTSSMLVNVNTASAGIIDGAIAVNYFSAGAVNGVSNGLGILAVGSDSYGVSGLIETTGQIITAASPLIDTAQPIEFGNVRIGADAPTALVSVTNQATGDPQAALNAEISGSAPITASGGFALLNPGATNASSLQVGMQTSTAGAIDGTATIAFVSDASNVGGCEPNCQMDLPSQEVQVTGAVYRLANPEIDTAQPLILAARVGDAIPTQHLSLTNQSPDAFTEGLKADIGTVDAGFIGTGGITNLAAQDTDSTSLSVALASTAVSQAITGTVGLEFQSTGAGTTGAEDIAVGSSTVDVAGRVYQQAIAEVDRTTVDFGIVHVGADLSAQLEIRNAASMAALNDRLQGGWTSDEFGAFSTSGDLGPGLEAGMSATLGIDLDTSTAGVFSATGQVATQSVNPDLDDLALDLTEIFLAAQVNNYANPWFRLESGLGDLRVVESGFVIDYGALAEDLGPVATSLGFTNDVTGPADALRGHYDTSAVDSVVFSVAGFDPFEVLEAGQGITGLDFSFDTGALGRGWFAQTIVLNTFGFNASGYDQAFDPIRLTFQGTVDEPQAQWLILFGLAALYGLRWRRAT